MTRNKNEQFLIQKISHELRNPLTMMSSTLQLIESQHPETKTFRHWSALMQDVEFMTHLLDDLSRWNHADSLKLSCFSLRSLLEQVTLSFAASIADTRLEYTSKIDSSINQITGDKTKLQEVFLNLLKNAAEATSPKGEISMHAFCENDSITILIKDDGCGIPKEQLHTIFEPFTTYKQGGTGLGLAISNSIIQAHHGSIQVSSSVGKGSTFRIMLPANDCSHKDTCE